MMHLAGGRVRVELLAALCVVGCDLGEPPRLAEIPYPPLDPLEERVREQLLGARRELERELAAPGLDRPERSDAYGRAGMVYHAHGQRGTAQACYLNAQKLTPGEFRWPYLLGDLHLARGESEAAIASFRRALELRPDDLPALVRLADAELRQNRADLAAPLFERALEVDSRCAAAHVGLGKIASSRRDHATAARHFESALRLDPGATEVHYPLALAYRDLGRVDEAAALLEQRGSGRAAVADPLMEQINALAVGWRIGLNRGISLFQQEHYVEALAEFRSAAGEAPDDPIVRINLGSTLTELGDLEGAAAEFGHALESDPANAMAHFNLGTILARGGNDEAAIEHYQAALEANPDYLNAHFNLANALRRAGRFDEAGAHYRRVVEGDPRNSMARMAEALSVIRLHRYREALDRLNEAVEAVPEYLPARHALIRVLSAAPADGVRDGRRALALASDLLDQERSLPHVAAFAMAAAESGDFGVAIEWQQAGIDAAIAAGRSDLVPELRGNLERYRHGQACRAPWRDDDPILAPRESDGSPPS